VNVGRFAGDLPEDVAQDGPVEVRGSEVDGADRVDSRVAHGRDLRAVAAEIRDDQRVASAPAIGPHRRDGTGNEACGKPVELSPGERGP
jgi:hypothetical protein